MLIYEFRERVLQFKEEFTPAFPAHAKISAALRPRPPFGGELGVTRNASKDAKMTARYSPSTGRFYFQLNEPLFPQLSATSSTGIEVFLIEGS